MGIMETAELKEFLKLFHFKPELQGYIGIERERFLMTPGGVIVPRAKEFLDLIDDPQWTYELSACQVEDRTRPRKTIAAIIRELERNNRAAVKILQKLDLHFAPCEVAPTTMPHDIYPDARYLEIAAHISREQLDAALRVAGTHVHIGMPNMKEALRIYNRVQKHIAVLCFAGDHSHNERLRLYKTMAKNWYPPELKSTHHFFEIARAQGFESKPRNCYWLIRISIHGTIELRMFGVFPDTEEIGKLVTFIRSFL